MNFNKEHIQFSDTHQFSGLFIDYIAEDKKLQGMYSNYFDREGIKNYLNTHSFSYANREVLVAEAQEQNRSLQLSQSSIQNIASLKNANTFTVTTGHQLCLFTGPMYFIYKILTTINSCEYLNQQFPDKHFVPVYWMASEDHDYEEISSAIVFGKKITWQTQQSGKVGSFSTQGIENAVKELEEILGTGDQSKHITDLLTKCYSQSTLADATRMLVNELFGKYGIVIIDGDSSALKTLFKEEIKKELESGFSFKAVNETSSELKNAGYSLQVNPREINLFYAKNGVRERIEKNDTGYKVVNTDLKFTPEELMKLVDAEPALFSPNVITRPLYQQKILPNIAYVGGPGEIAYWLQLKKEFTEINIHFPILVPRKFALIIDAPTQSKLHKAGLSEKQLFHDTELLIKEFISADGSATDFNVERDQLGTTFNALKQKAEGIDKSLGGSVDAELQKALKSIEHIEQKIVRALKAKNETSVNQIKTIKQKLFPEHSIQERHDNFTQYWLKNENFIADLKTAFATDMEDLGSYLLLKESEDKN